MLSYEGGDVTRPPMERHLNWIPDPAPISPRNNGKENLPPSAEPRKLPRKIRSHRQRKEHHHHLGATGSAPGTSQPPRCARSTPVKHPQPLQRPQHPQPHRPAANHNSARPDLLDQAELGRLYKPGPAPASARISQPDLVETTSPGVTSPSTAHSDLIETTSLGRPVGH